MNIKLASPRIGDEEKEHKEQKEQKEQILKDIKLQRHALLGTLARCMEYLKQIKNDEAFSALQARKLRNYLFKGKRFLMKKEKDVKSEMELNHRIIEMMNEIVKCLRAKEPDLSQIKSTLFQEMQAEADNFLGEKDSDKPLESPSDLPSGKPWLSACKSGLKRANTALEYYITHKDKYNEILIQCAENYLLAARGTFAMWIRDYHPKYYRHTPDYKEMLDLYIEQGNKIRHNEKGQTCQPSL
jgi:hypothetical protein